jgi:hypothetical protein
MKKIRFLSWILLGLLVLPSGVPAQKVDKTEEEGVEVVLNHFEPYELAGGSADIALTEELVIDLEDPAVSGTGLYDLVLFGADSRGDIYLVSYQSQTDHIFKFDARGKFIRSFGKHGQGPGELARPVYMWITDKNEIYVSDQGNIRLSVFTTDGEFVREKKYKTMLAISHPLDNGGFVTFGGVLPEEGQKYIEYPLNLCGADFQPEKKLESFRMENFRMTRRIKGTPPGFGFAVSGSRIFTGNEIRDYDILVYDHSGRLVRKIRKEYKPVPVTEEFKKQALERVNEFQRKYTYFPKLLPPFRSLFADEGGSLFVVTHEKGEGEEERMVDVFNPDGVFVARFSLNIFQGFAALTAFVKSGRLYYLREKESGYKQFVVCRLDWN